MEFFIFHLPRELCAQIINHLGPADLVRVSSTCKRCRDELAPTVFETLRFSNAERSCASALAAAQKHGRFTRRLVFRYRPRGESVEASSSARGAGATPAVRNARRLRVPVLRPAARRLLTGAHTPSLRAVEFRFRFSRYKENSEEDCSVWRPGIDFGWVGSFELYHAWRALMNEAYLAVAENRVVTELVLTGLPPLVVSAFSARPFHDFLARVKSATIHLLDPLYCPISMGVEFRIHYHFFIGMTLKELLSLMSGLEHLALHGSHHLPLGKPECGAAPLPLVPGEFPSLRSLELGYCSTEPDVVEFLEAQIQTLSSLVLNNCMVETKSYYAETSPLPTWARFFHQLQSRSPPLLTNFAVTYDATELLVDCPMPSSGDAEQQRGDEAGFRPGFAYIEFRRWRRSAAIELCYGNPPTDMAEDERAYERLLQLTKSNADRIAQESRNQIEQG